MKDECTLEAVIQLPPEYPLRNVEVSCSKRMGVSESRYTNVAVKGVLMYWWIPVNEGLLLCWYVINY